VEKETPYGESRGGHVPEAKHLFYKALLDSDGKVLPRDQIKAKLFEIGVKEDDKVVSYCTGGVRAAFGTVLLNNAGIAARNYAGSMWEWSALPLNKYPLGKDGEDSAGNPHSSAAPGIDPALSVNDRKHPSAFAANRTTAGRRACRFRRSNRPLPWARAQRLPSEVRRHGDET
jgi:rhodanese-related sulfurtransferase